MSQRSGARIDGATAATVPSRPAIASTSRNGIRLVELAGDHDVTTAAGVRAAIRGENAARANVVVSLEQVTFIDSAIVGLLFTSSRALMENGGRLVVHCPDTTPVSQVLQHVYFGGVVDVVGTLQEAVDLAAAA
jgi:stage II sporulation protein AA (anti-sigma F factor antagonist)